MPEQFEVSRMADYLKQHQLEKQGLKKLCFPNQGARMLKNIDEVKLAAFLKDKQLLAITCKAKYTFLHFESGTLVWHYRFTGIPHLKGKPYQENLYTLFSLPIHLKETKHCRMIMTFEKDELYYIDTRCLSALNFFEEREPHETPIYKTLANDLNHDLEPDFRLFKQQTRSRKINIKQWLLLQDTAPSGIGNYLACEILAAARLHPFMKVKDLEKSHYEALRKAIKSVREQAKKSPSYEWFLVFNRKKCGRCAAKVLKERLPKNAQTSHFCSQCQTLTSLINFS